MSSKNANRDGSSEWPTIPVYLNHLEAMSIGMALMDEKQRDDLSAPQEDALLKIQAAIGELLADLR